MKIVIASSMYPPEIGRPATYIKELAENLSKQHYISIVAYTNTKDLNNNFDLVSVNKRLPLPIRLIYFFFALWKTSRGADIIYAQNAMSAGFPTALVSMLRRLPFVIAYIGDEAYERASQRQLTKKGLEDFLQNPDGDWKIRLMTKIQTFVLRRAQKIITSTSYTKRLIEKTHHTKTRKTVVNLPHLEKMETLPFNTPRKQHNILVINKNITQEKLVVFVDAFLEIKKVYPDSELNIVSKSVSTEFLKNLKIDEAFKKDIVLHGKISRTEEWSLLREGGIYIHEQVGPQFPYQILKSFATGTPVIALETEITREIIDEKEMGLLLKKFDASSLTQAINDIFKNSHQYNDLKNLDSKSIEKKFSVKSHLDKLSAILESILTKPLDVV